MIIRSQNKVLSCTGHYFQLPSVIEINVLCCDVGMKEISGSLQNTLKVHESAFSIKPMNHLLLSQRVLSISGLLVLSQKVNKYKGRDFDQGVNWIIFSFLPY